MPKEPTLTLALTQFIDSHLGRGLFINESTGVIEPDHKWHSRPIDPDLAIIIFALTKNEHTCVVQWADKYNPNLKTPVLWEYNAWAYSTERFERSQRRMQLEADEREVFAANVKIVARAWSEYALVPLDNAQMIAFNMIKNNRVAAMKEIGVEKLYTSIEELK